MINNINVVPLHGEIPAKTRLEKPEHACNVRKLTRKKVQKLRNVKINYLSSWKRRKAGMLSCFK